MRGVAGVAAALTLAAVGRGQEIAWSTDAARAGGAKGTVALPDGRVLAARTEVRHGIVTMLCSESSDEGRTWREAGVIATDPDPGADLGDGNLLRRRDGTLLYVYRDNHYRGEKAKTPRYAVRVSQSADGGRTWTYHSLVETSLGRGEGPSRGLWAPFLFETSRGELQCYYDDEYTPWRDGFAGHQWVRMKRYEPASRRWVDPVTVSRAHRPAHLSRDGMATVVELPSGRLLCALESVQVDRPHAGVARLVTSDDGGRAWSWRHRERAVLYEPKDRRFLVFAPWLIRLPDGTLACVFVTSEDMPEPGVSGTPAHLLKLDVKYVLSRDGGTTWDRSARPLYAGTHRNYLPGLVVLPSRSLLLTFLDFDKGHLAIRGNLQGAKSLRRD
jgi:hypothetical protein